MAHLEQGNGEKLQRRREGGKSVRSSPVAVRIKTATPEQEQRVQQAIDLFLAEWVRRRLSR